MCYGMRCPYEDSMGECTWEGGLPFPCPSPEVEETELIEERKIVEHYTHKYEDSLLAEARRENEKLRDAIEEALEYMGPEWASILRYALKGDGDG